MTVSFVVPHWNRHELLPDLVRSIERQREAAPGGMEVIVVDNGSNDRSAEVAESLGARVIRLDRNEGFGRAVNRGIEAATGDWIALVNNDVELAGGWLREMLHGAEAANAWFAAGKVLDAADHSQVDGAGDAVCRGGTAWRLGHGRPEVAVFGQVRQIYFPSATATLFRREFFERAGGFDESFFAYLEDVDLGLRAAIADLPGVYVPDARAFHQGSRTGGAWSGPVVTWMTCNQLLLLAKFYPARLLVRFACPILAAQCLWAALAISRGRGLPWIRGVWEGLKRARRIRRAGAGLREGSDRLPPVLMAAEAQIGAIQRSLGWDSYWKWYFRLALPPVPEAAA